MTSVKYLLSPPNSEEYLRAFCYHHQTHSAVRKARVYEKDTKAAYDRGPEAGQQRLTAVLLVTNVAGSVKQPIERGRDIYHCA